jgi:hypothetical protein
MTKVASRRQKIMQFRKTETHRYMWRHPQISESLEVVAPDPMIARYQALAVLADRFKSGRLTERYWTAWVVYVQTTDPVEL